jgi:5-(carboxyamino)imidazole ribonucleotide synthase
VTVGIVGAGQLARMTLEAASALGLDVLLLAERADDAAAKVAAQVMVGRPTDPDALAALAERSSVVTFDHELVDLGQLRALADRGTVLRPGVGTLSLTVDKAAMRRTLRAAGIPVPAFEVVEAAGAAERQAAVEAFAAAHGWPVMVKAARGGYDGRGVFPAADPAGAAEAVGSVPEAVALVVEELVALDTELAVLVARRPDGRHQAWPAVETAQVEGVCREVLVPGRLDPALAAEAVELGVAVAEVAGAVGVLAVELFVSGGRLLVNELAARPHNTGHWTIEGAVTSQFENHLRAVLDLPLGLTTPSARAVASVNVFGASDGTDPSDRLPLALAVPGAHVHLYGKAPRPGRKLGHVTVCGDDEGDVRRRAWTAAQSLGTPVPASIDLDPVRSGTGR